MLWPPQRTPISRPRSRAACTAVATSRTEAHWTISFGRWSIIAFQTDRAESYPGVPGVRTRPSKREGRTVGGNCGVVVMAHSFLRIGPLDKLQFCVEFGDQFVTGLGAGDRPGSHPR